MAQIDRKLAVKLKRKHERQEAIKARTEREELRHAVSNGEAVVETFESDSEKSCNENVDSDHDSAVTPQTKQPRPKNIVSPQVAAALDRTKISDRNAVYALASFSVAVGQNPSELALNRWSIRRNRMKHRYETILKLKESFGENIRDVPLVVHWDSKLLPDISGKQEKINRLPILVSGQGVERLLNVPKLPNGTGEAMANAVVTAIDNWNLAENIKAMSFDTTASNSGIRSGAAVLIEQKMNKELLHLACRHHIFEVVLGDVFNSLAGPSTGPDILMFKRFQTAWPSIVCDRYEDGISDPETALVFSSNREMMKEAIDFIQNCLLTENQPRDDYRELLELSLIYLGHIPPRGVHFMAPGAMHRARWMAMAIYSIKIFLFRSQFRMTKREINLSRFLNIFVCFVYLNSWFTASLSIQAPLNDLMCLKRLTQFRTINLNGANVAIKALSRHMWYLSEELIAFSFFDDRVDAATKYEMVNAMKTKTGNGIPAKRVQLRENNISSSELADFINSNTMRFFVILGISTSWLELDSSLWNEDQVFIAAKHFVAGLSVVNDRAERGVALIQDFNQILTKDEGQKQALLHVVSEHRKQFPDAKKSTVVKQD